MTLEIFAIHCLKESPAAMMSFDLYNAASSYVLIGPVGEQDRKWTFLKCNKYLISSAGLDPQFYATSFAGTIKLRCNEALVNIATCIQ